MQYICITLNRVGEFIERQDNVSKLRLDKSWMEVGIKSRHPSSNERQFAIHRLQFQLQIQFASMGRRFFQLLLS